MHLLGRPKHFIFSLAPSPSLSQTSHISFFCHYSLQCLTQSSSLHSCPNLLNHTQCRINHCFGCTMGGGPRRQGAPDQLANFLPRCFDVWTLRITFRNYKFRVRLRVTFGLNDRRILIQYPSWSAKGFWWSHRAINSSMGEAIGHRHVAFFLLTHFASWPRWSTVQMQTQELIFLSI